MLHTNFKIVYTTIVAATRLISLFALQKLVKRRGNKSCSELYTARYLLGPLSSRYTIYVIQFTRIFVTIAITISNTTACFGSKRKAHFGGVPYLYLRLLEV